MSKAVRTASGAYRVRLYCGRDAAGRQIFKSFTAATRREAERLAAAYDVSQAFDPAPASASNRLLLVDAVDQFIETCRCTKKSPSTIRGYAAISRVLRQSLASVYLDDLTPVFLQEWINKQSSRVSPKTLRNYWAVIRPVLKLHCPDLRLDVLRFPKSQNDDDVVIPTSDQVTRLLQAADAAHDDELYIAILLAAFCGLRRSEICALQWEDIDRRLNQLRINKAKVRDDAGAWVVKPVTKTKAGKRTITVDSSVVQQLFARRNASRYMIHCTPNDVYNHYARLAASFGIPTRLHFLRHYHCSVLISLGYPERYIMDRLGWNSAEMIRRVYGHVVADKKEALDNGLSGFTQALIAGERFNYR